MASLTRLRKQLMLGLPPAWSVPLHAWKNRFQGEPELRWLSELCDPDLPAVDVGANVGIYTYWLMRYARGCHSFEANPDLASRLKRYAHGRRLTVWSMALSDTVGRVTLHVPVDARTGLQRAGSASIVSHSATGPVVDIEVDQARLDELDLPRVGFVKVDVEGFEMNVLRGAAKTIERDMPNVLVEAENRHRPNAVGDVIAWFGHRGYVGYYLRDGRWRSAQGFDAASLQDEGQLANGRRPGSLYINNFLFLNDRTRRRFVERNLADA
jgi:FkbM family methyltransferase